MRVFLLLVLCGWLQCRPASSTETLVQAPPELFASVPSDNGSIVHDAASNSGLTHPENEYHMPPVRAVHARAVSDLPMFDDVLGRFISAFGPPDSVTGYVAAMDSVTTASVEGALYYVQTQGINQRRHPENVRCRRHNDIQFLVFYEVMIAQPNASRALYQHDRQRVPEYGPFVAMDHGRCSPLTLSSVNGTDVFPPECLAFHGMGDQPLLGPYVGAESKMKDARAPYPDAYWFSFPGSCPLQPWILKTPACRAQTRSGLCERGETPDGVACTFAYNILGFLPLDDLVGITRTLNNATNKPFANFSEFCRFGHVEFDATDEGDVVQSLPFWTNPQDIRYNNLRTQQMLTTYRRLASPDGKSSQIDPHLRAKMQSLPSIQELRDSNPPCYMSVPMCSQAKFGCRRETYAQICRVCVQEEADCVVTPPTFEFPELEAMENEAVDASVAISLWMPWWWMILWTLLCVYY